MFSVAMNGNSCKICLSITFGYTTNPSDTFCNVFKTTSAVRNASGNVIRRFALLLVHHKNQTNGGDSLGTDESSRVLSNHCTLAVMTAFWWRVMRCRDKLHILSDRIGLRLYAIAEDPICVDSKGSSSS